MAQALYHSPSASFTLAAASSTLPAYIIANTDTNHGLMLKKYRISMSGTGAASVLVQIVATGTAATAAGTSTANTAAPLQVAGRTVTAGGITIGQCNYTAARTTETYTILDEFYMTNNNTVIYDYPWGDEPDVGVGVATFGSGFGVLFTSGTPVASTVDMWVARI